MAPHSSTLAWKIPWMEEPGRLQSMGSLRVGQDWATSLSLFTFMHWRRKWQLTPVFLPGESQGWGILVGCCLWGRTESDTTEVTQQQRLSYEIWHCVYVESKKKKMYKWTCLQKAVLSWGLPCGSDGKESACSAGDLHLIPGWEKSPGEGNGSPLQYSFLEGSKDRRTWHAIVHEVTKELDVTERLTLSLSS